MQSIQPCLWFDSQAEEAAAFYVSIFKDSRIVDIARYPEGSPGTAGTVMTVAFVLDGQEFLALNGGPFFTFSPAISLVVNCETQAEVDDLWETTHRRRRRGAVRVADRQVRRVVADRAERADGDDERGGCRRRATRLHGHAPDEEARHRAPGAGVRECLTSSAKAQSRGGPQAGARDELAPRRTARRGRPHADVRGDLRDYIEAAVAGYADDNVASGRWPPEGAPARSRADFDASLPRGLETPDNYLFEIRDAGTGVTVGSIWFAVREEHGLRTAFVYDVEVRPESRRRGYATAAFQALEPLVRDLGLTSIGLHVFGHNMGARALYSRLGYEVTGLNMQKRLEDGSG